jgi:hypothetical protein
MNSYEKGYKRGADLETSLYEEPSKTHEKPWQENIVQSAFIEFENQRKVPR